MRNISLDKILEVEGFRATILSALRYLKPVVAITLPLLKLFKAHSDYNAVCLRRYNCIYECFKVLL